MRDINLNNRLIDALDSIIAEVSGEISEYDLIQFLDERYPELYPKPDLSDPLLLFQHHFYLRHSLYALQEKLVDEQRGDLELCLTQIKKKPFSILHDDLLPTEADTVKSYYCDIANMNKEDTNSVQKMLDGFWLALANFNHQPKAFITLGLSGKESSSDIKKRYKKLAQEHHPDKGGNSQRFNEIQQAWDILKDKKNDLR